MAKPRWTLNRNEGTDTIHRDGREECNLDDAEGRQTIDAKTAASLIASGSAVPCQHCIGPKGEEAHL